MVGTRGDFDDCVSALNDKVDNNAASAVCLAAP